MRSRETRIFVATHFATHYPEHPGYVPIHVGRALAADGFTAVDDASGDSISRLNPTFCELTALYWIWKNDSAQTVGLNHYRRYFAHKERAVAFGEHEVASIDDFTELREGADIIVPEPVPYTIHMGGVFAEPVLVQYYRAHIGPDLFMARQEIKLQCPDYLDAFDFMMQSNSLVHYNMFVARRHVIDDYCPWLFAILFKLEKLIPSEFYDGYNKRVMGFIAERLFNLWLLENRRRYRVAYRPIVRTMPEIW